MHSPLLKSKFLLVNDSIFHLSSFTVALMNKSGKLRGLVYSNSVKLKSFSILHPQEIKRVTTCIFHRIFSADISKWAHITHLNNFMQTYIFVCFLLEKLSWLERKARVILNAKIKMVPSTRRLKARQLIWSELYECTIHDTRKHLKLQESRVSSFIDGFCNP